MFKDSEELLDVRVASCHSKNFMSSVRVDFPHSVTQHYTPPYKPPVQQGSWLQTLSEFG